MSVLIDKAMLLRAVPGLYKSNVDAFVRDMNQWSGTFGLTSGLRMAHFLAQVFHESGCLRYTEEIASGKAYEWRADLGNTHKGDGVRFKGRGYLQLTGRANYQAYARSKWCVGDLMSHPEWLASSPGNVKSALWYWWNKNLSRYADADNTEMVTRKINGGLNGLAQRKYYLRRFKKELGL